MNISNCQNRVNETDMYNHPKNATTWNQSSDSSIFRCCFISLQCYIIQLDITDDYVRKYPDDGIIDKRP